MPSWGVHLVVANKLINRLEKDLNKKEKNEFIFANLLPDINNGWVIKNISKIISHKKTHFDPKIFKNDGSDIHGYKAFYEKYKNSFKNLSVLGYYTHLLTDYYFNNITYGKYGIYDENNNFIGIKLNTGENLIAEREECRKIKANDFKLFASSLYKNADIKVPEYDEDILKNAEEIERIDVTKQDIEETIKHIKKCVKDPEFFLDTAICLDYKIFTEKELDKILNSCVDFIIEKI